MSASDGNGRHARADEGIGRILELWALAQLDENLLDSERRCRKVPGGDSGCGSGDEWDDDSKKEYAEWSDDVNRQHESEADEAWAAEELERMQREEDERRNDR